MELTSALYNSIFQDYPDIVSAEEMAKMLGIGRNSAYDLIHKQTVKCIKVGRKIKVPKINVIAFLLKACNSVE